MGPVVTVGLMPSMPAAMSPSSVCAAVGEEDKGADDTSSALIAVAIAVRLSSATGRLRAGLLGGFVHPVSTATRSTSASSTRRSRTIAPSFVLVRLTGDSDRTWTRYGVVAGRAGIHRRNVRAVRQSGRHERSHTGRC